MTASVASSGFEVVQRILPLLAAVIITATTIELIRRRKLREEYAMLWIAASVVLLVFAAYPRLLFLISNLLGVYYLTTTLILTFSFLSLLILHLAVIVSRLSSDNCRIAQRVALLERKLEELAATSKDKQNRPENE